MEMFGYHALFRRPEMTTPSRLIAVRVKADPLQAVIWHVPTQRWMYSPEIAAPWLFHDQYMDQNRPVDRPTAERIAAESLATELPSAEELHRICEVEAQPLMLPTDRV